MARRESPKYKILRGSAPEPITAIVSYTKGLCPREGEVKIYCMLNRRLYSSENISSNLQNKESIYALTIIINSI